MESTPEEQAAAIEAAQAVMRRMVTELPPELQPTLRRTIVEAVGPEALAYMQDWFARQDAAETAALALSKSWGGDGFFPPSQSWGSCDDARPTVYAFPEPPAADAGWIKAGNHYQCRNKCAPYRPGKKAAGKALLAKINELPPYPLYREAEEKVGVVTDLRSTDGWRSCGVGHSNGSLHFTICVRIEERFFVDFPNWNYDIGRKAQDLLEYPNYGKPGDFDYVGDPIGWRPPEGWVLVSQPQFQIIYGEASLRLQRAKLAASAEPALADA